MIHIVTRDNRHLFETDLTLMHAHRKAVFVDQLHWNVPVVGEKHACHSELAPEDEAKRIQESSVPAV